MWPVIEIAVEPKSQADQQKLDVALQTLAAEDRSFRASIDQESGQTILRGKSELHLDSKIETLIRTYEVEINIGAPQVAYRETLGRRAEIDFTHKKQAGGSGQFARLKVVSEPGEPGSGYKFESKVVGGSVPKKYIPGVRKGLKAARENGLLAGFPVIDFTASLVDGSYHDVDSSVLAFEIAARAAFRELRDQARPRLLEPIMKVRVVTREDCAGPVLGDLHGRRGQILGQEVRGNVNIITAMVPLGNMFGYIDNLRGMSQGRAKFTMRYSHYAPLALGPLDDDPRFPPAMAMKA